MRHSAHLLLNDLLLRCNAFPSSEQRPEEKHRRHQQQCCADRPRVKYRKTTARDQQRLTQRRFHHRTQNHRENERRAFKAEPAQEKTADPEDQHEGETRYRGSGYAREQLETAGGFTAYARRALGPHETV